MSDSKTKQSAETSPKSDGGLPADPNALSGFAAAALGPRRRRRSEKPAEEAAPTVAPAADDPAKPPTESSTGSVSSPETSIPEQPKAPEPAPAAEEAPAPVETAAPQQTPAAELAEEQVQEAQEAPEPAAAPVERREVAVVAPQAAAPAPVVARALPDLGIRREGPSEQRSTQCTVNVSVSVRDRFAAYQLAKKLERGSEPTNAVVVRRAVLHARKNDLFGQMLEAIRHRQTPLDEEDDDPEGLFGDVQGRRVERGRGRDIAQQSFRPSYEELAVIDALMRAYGFENRSVFLDAALDAFLPPLPSERRRRS